MFLMIFEDFSVIAVSEILDDDKQASDDGYLDIIDLSDSENPKRYMEGEWYAVESKKNSHED